MRSSRLHAVSVFVGALAVSCSSNERAPECVDRGAAAIRVCASGATVAGVDVSYYQAQIDWTKVRASGVRFAFARASDGVRFPDSAFARNWRGMKAAGIVRGVYQFFRPGQDAIAQADLVVSSLATAGGLESGDLPVVLDLESSDGQPNDVVVARSREWLARIEAKTGRTPLVYTAAYFANTTIGAALASYPLWVANYGATCPTMPSAWARWEFWQKTDSGDVAGIPTKVDLDDFNGSLADLIAFAGSRAPGSPVDGGAPLADAGVGSWAIDAPRAERVQGSVMGDGDGAERGGSSGSSEGAASSASAVPEPCL